jgi:hypothetical protein
MIVLPMNELISLYISNIMHLFVLFPVAQRLAQRSLVAVLIPEDSSATAVPPFESRPDVVGWHSVRVCGKEIDFALLLPGIGLFVFEVKDWKHGNIFSTGSTAFTLRTVQNKISSRNYVVATDLLKLSGLEFLWRLSVVRQPNYSINLLR